MENEKTNTLPLIKHVPANVLKIIAAIGTIATLLVTFNQLSDYYINKIDNLIKGSITQSTIQITTQLKNTEQTISDFLIDDIRFRLLATGDEIAFLKKEGLEVPRYLDRQHELLTDQLKEAREEWSN